MMKLTCKEINPNTDCGFEATGENTKEVAEVMIGHAKANHEKDIEGVSDENMMQKFEEMAHS